MIFNIDVDDTIAHLKPEWLRRYNEEYSDNLELNQITDWPMIPFVKPECGASIYKYLRDQDLYEHIEPIKDSLDTIIRLRKAGHTVNIVTANARGTGDQKLDWLVRHGYVPDTRAWPQDLIICNAKWKIDGDVFIDDKADAVIDWVNKKRKKAIILDYAWNREAIRNQPSSFFSWCTVARDWNHIRQIVGV